MPLLPTRYNYMLNHLVNWGDPAKLARGSVCACDRIGTVRASGSHVKDDGSSTTLMCDVPYSLRPYMWRSRRRLSRPMPRWSASPSLRRSFSIAE